MSDRPPTGHAGRGWFRRLWGNATAAGASPGPPYPVSVAARDVAAERLIPGAGVELFDTPEALAINRARMDHLGSLGLDLASKTVLDVGCGVGHLAQFFVRQGCPLTCLDARADNVESLRTRYPGLAARVADVRDGLPADLGSFQVVFCYGLLYHLEDPVAALRHFGTVCTELLLLETMVCDSREPVMHLVDDPITANQATAGLGCRPSPSFVAMALNRVGFPHVYGAARPPEHPDFTFTWKDDGAIARNGVNLRCVFVASRQPLQTPALAGLLVRGR
jgi:SAM-dependent methyltransferase